MKRIATFIGALALLPSFASATVVQRARYLMGTVCEVAVSGSPDPATEIEAAFAEARRIESMLSTWTTTSELARLNANPDAAHSDELRDLLASVTAWSEKTGGTFDPRIGRLIEVWNVRGEGATPDSAAVDRARSDRTQWEEGGFGKGYALDRMLDSIAASAAVMNFGGQIAVRGEVEATIADPRTRDEPVVSLQLRNESLSTTSGSEKTFQSEGIDLSHVIDPRTGRPLPPRGSVSVIHESALAADLLSTALYVMGVEEGLAWADAHRIAAVFIDDRNQIRPSAEAWTRDLAVINRKFNIRK